MTTRSHHSASGSGAWAATPSEDARVAPLAASLAARLADVCREWDAAEFAALIEQVARTKLRWRDCGYDE